MFTVYIYIYMLLKKKPVVRGSTSPHNRRKRKYNNVYNICYIYTLLYIHAYVCVMFQKKKLTKMILLFTIYIWDMFIAIYISRSLPALSLWDKWNPYRLRYYEYNK